MAENHTNNAEQSKITSEDFVDFVVEYDAKLLELATNNPDIVIGYRFQSNLAIIYVRRKVADSIINQLTVLSNLSYPLLFGISDIAILSETGILPIQNNPSLGLRGSGVLLGVVDTGIDYTHPAFLYEDGTSKIKFIWDQTDFCGKIPSGFKYGSEYTQEDVDRALASGNPLTQVPTRDDHGHGTFLAGVASGFERETYEGVAPDSELIIVKLAPAKRYARENNMLFRENAIAYQDTDILAGLFYVVDKAQELNMPVSIALGVGTTQGGHDGFSYFPINGIRRNLVISSACGNEGDARNHTSGTLTTNTVYNMELHIAQDEPGCVVYIWGFAPDKMSIGLVSPSGEKIEKIAVRNITQEKYKLLFHDTTIWVTYYIAVDRN